MEIQDKLHSETLSIIDEIIECNKRNPNQVKSIISNLSQILQKYNKTCQDSYMNKHNLNEKSLEIGLIKLEKHATPFLVSILKLFEDENDDFYNEISSLMALLCGKAAVGESISQFEFENAGLISLRETSYTEAEIGFQTWGGGILMAKYY